MVTYPSVLPKLEAPTRPITNPPTNCPYLLAIFHHIKYRRSLVKLRGIDDIEVRIRYSWPKKQNLCHNCPWPGREGMLWVSPSPTDCSTLVSVKPPAGAHFLVLLIARRIRATLHIPSHSPINARSWFEKQSKSSPTRIRESIPKPKPTPADRSVSAGSIAHEAVPRLWTTRLKMHQLRATVMLAIV